MIHTVRRSSSYATSARLGAVDNTTQIVGTTASVADAGLGVTAAAASSGLITLGATAAAAIPVAGAVIAVGVLIYSLLHNSRGLQQDAETTAQVNKAAVYMQSNLDAWNASDKNLASQAQALANFDAAWEAIVNFCGQASEGSPGQRCISERQRGGKYDFFSYYRDPIANDPAAGAIDRQLAADAAAAAAAANPIASALGVTTPAGISLASLAIPAGLLLMAFLVPDK
jgi:hypothetical protein